MQDYFFHIRKLAICCLIAIGITTQSTFGQLLFEPSWELPSYNEVRDTTLAWIETLQIDEQILSETDTLWPAENLHAVEGADILNRVVETFAIFNPKAEAFVTACNREHIGPLPPDAAWLMDHGLSGFLQNNLRLYYARWLAQRGLYDEVLSTLDGLSPADVVDPASLLFYRMVAHQQLVEPDKSRAALSQLLEHEEALPRRYQQVANLVSRDLADLKDESLDHIARRMNDVRRRLEIGRAGKQVQMVEQGVIDSLDKLIEKLEEQQQQQQASGGGGSSQGSKPMQDSRLPSMKAPMKVDQKDIGSQSGWGDLPAKEREQALQQIGREFPAHYRDLIEQYFRELADDASESPDN